jgi:hypothetical protein
MNRSNLKKAAKNRIIQDPEILAKIAMHLENHVQEVDQLILLPQIIRDILVQDRKVMYQGKVRNASQKVVREVPQKRHKMK